MQGVRDVFSRYFTGLKSEMYSRLNLYIVLFRRNEMCTISELTLVVIKEAF